MKKLLVLTGIATALLYALRDNAREETKSKSPRGVAR